MNKKRRPSLQDVANLVGVTKMTVSRYLRDPQQVSKPIQEKLALAIDSLGYINNRAPTMLSNAKSQAIGILVPSLTNQVFAEVIRGIESITEGAGYQTMLAHYGYCPDIEEKRIASLLSYNVDGLLLSDTMHNQRTLKMIQTAGVPVIEMMDTSSTCIEQAVGFDNILAAHKMTETLINKGYQHIVYLGARLDKRTQLKYQGYEKAMKLHQLSPINISTPVASSFSLGAHLLQQTLRQYPQTDAIFCTNDDLAVGAIFECQRQGINIPQEMAIAGFHGHDIGQSIVPKLASVITPREKIGQIAAQALLARLNGDIHDNIPCQQKIDLGFTIDCGESI
ncbi:gluconate operon transcriptional repressor GntR [Shewanella surugensis]|uniref:Gluconate operon transcriptional repressor GntR n=1 Tax=Shewanella surugensis TaxID=212020 RepID=A0ABT0LGT7_9GAMM|nr:gluconate operon transcriptional repressor GntR [Shewanella surugensis]MCL1126580.1 gluconate operon transcriptional repressor GntR [Shewanella surugensis]